VGRCELQSTQISDPPLKGELDLFSAAASLSEALRELGMVPSIALLLDELELVPREVRTYLPRRPS